MFRILYNDKRETPPKKVTIINTYKPYIRVPKYMKLELTELKRKTDNSTITVGNLNTPLSKRDRTRQKIHKDIEYLNNPINQQTSVEHSILQQQNIYSY